MSYLSYDFPHTRNQDSDLRQILEMYETLRNLPNEWENFKKSVANNETINELTIFFGDSYSAYTDGLPDQLSKLLGIPRENYKTFAKSGIGYVRPSDGITLYGLVEQAIAAYTEAEKLKVKNIYFFAGINDTNPEQDKSLVESSATLCYSTLKGVFPNAKIYTGMPYPNHTLTRRKLQIPAAISSAALASGSVYLPHLYLALIGKPDYMSVDGIHPNASGFQYLSRYIYSVINKVPDFSYDLYNPNENYASGWIACIRQGGVVTYYGSVTPNEAAGTIIDLSNSPYVSSMTFFGALVSYGLPVSNAYVYNTAAGALNFQGVTPGTPYNFCFSTLTGINEF